MKQQSTNIEDRVGVLIIGARPVGLTLAIDLAR
jgi:2-polyprenyl-6-methoxyphenol hydroxylase-like FAD-dependent oxidoreductase